MNLIMKFRLFKKFSFQDLTIFPPRTVEMKKKELISFEIHVYLAGFLLILFEINVIRSLNVFFPSSTKQKDHMFCSNLAG